jgi:Protein of unknown function (DUF2865)
MRRQLYREYSMSDHLARRVDPRALLGVGTPSKVTSQIGRPVLRLAAASLAAVIGLSAFGTMVVRANDDAGVLAFVRTQSRNMVPGPAARAAPAQAYPVAYYAPRAFFPTSQPAPAQRRTAAQQPGARLVASYAPFAGILPNEQVFQQQQAEPRRRAKAVNRETAAVRHNLPTPSRPVLSTGSRVTYCVRTCDGFYFPIGTGSGSDSADAAACNRLCPTAETRVYTGEVGSDIDTARARESGKRYASLGQAFSYRKSFDKACSCTANGVGIATDFSVYRDGSLRVGDIVMTGKGMRVFNGGTFPYREANFTAISRSDRIDNATRESLRKVEQASLPGRSGLAAASRKPSDELRDLAAANRTAQGPVNVVRYVGPDRSTIR